MDPRLRVNGHLFIYQRLDRSSKRPRRCLEESGPAFSEVAYPCLSEVCRVGSSEEISGTF